jgi:hypothetical protein
VKRPGHTYRIHDFKIAGRPLVLAFDPDARGGMYSPRVSVHWNTRPGGWSGRGYIGGHSVSVDLPHLSFATAFKLRRFGALRAYSAMARLIYWLFNGRTGGTR